MTLEELNKTYLDRRVRLKKNYYWVAENLWGMTAIVNGCQPGTDISPARLQIYLDDIPPGECSAGYGSEFDVKKRVFDIDCFEPIKTEPLPLPG